MEPLFNKATGMKASNFTKNSLQPLYDLVNTEKVLRTPILKNTCERLLLYTVSYFGENNKNKHIYVYIT